jgi:hypothetical protein
VTRIVLAARARLSERCTYRVRMPVAGPFRARFGGNGVLRAASAK